MASPALATSEPPTAAVSDTVGQSYSLRYYARLGNLQFFARGNSLQD